ncbi:hypothetical protein CR513_35817, partial [Mucuna pruriens]
MENNLLDQVWFVRMACHAIWANKCPEYIHKTHEPRSKKSHWMIHDVQHVLKLLKDESLYVNLEKFTFCTQEVAFLEFGMGSKRL